MYFKKFDQFINEDKQSKLERKKKNQQNKLDQQKANDKSDKKIERTEKKLQKTDDKLEDIQDTVGDTGQVIDTPQQNKEVDAKTDTETAPEEEKKTASNQELIDSLNNWNSSYAQAFKFQNDMPKNADIKSDEFDGQFQTLQSVVAKEYKSQVANAIEKLVDILSKGTFNEKTIDVIGHTSSPASNEYNKALSNRRSMIVINAIKDKYKQKTKEETKAILRPLGKGEESLIITNDEESSNDVKDVKVSSDYNKKNIINALNGDSSAEARQKINRRVEIQLKGVEAEYEIKDNEVKKSTVQGREKPSPPDPTKITFNYDSYLLSEDSKKLLKGFGSEVKSWNEESEDDKISTFYISAHTQIPKNEKKNDMKLHFVLSSNRAFMVRNYLQSGDVGLTDIDFNLLPVAYKIPNDNGDDKRVEISFDENEKIKKAKMEFAELVQSYNFIKADGDFYKPKKDGVVKNVTLRKNILFNIRQKYKGKQIPPELWHEDYSKLEKDLDLENFKTKVRKITGKNDDDIEADLVDEKF